MARGFPGAVTRRSLEVELRDMKSSGTCLAPREVIEGELSNSRRKCDLAVMSKLMRQLCNALYLSNNKYRTVTFFDALASRCARYCFLLRKLLVFLTGGDRGRPGGTRTPNQGVMSALL